MTLDEVIVYLSSIDERFSVSAASSNLTEEGMIVCRRFLVRDTKTFKSRLRVPYLEDELWILQWLGEATTELKTEFDKYEKRSVLL